MTSSSLSDPSTGPSAELCPDTQVMNLTMVDEHCAKIRQCRETVTAEELKISFDVFVRVLNQNKSHEIRNHLFGQIVSTLSHIPNRQKPFSEGDLIKHDLFFLLRADIVLDRFRRCHAEEKISGNLLLNVSVLFLNISSNVNDTNTTSIKDLLFSPALIKEIAQCLTEMATTGQHLNDGALLRTIGHFLSAFKHFLRTQTLTNEYAMLTPILHATIQCLSSPYAIEMIKRLRFTFQQKLADDQALFLDLFPLYLQWYSDYENPEYFLRILRNLLPHFVRWLTNCEAESFHRASSQMSYMVRHLSFFLIRPVESENMNMFSEEFSQDYCHLVTFWTTVLASVCALSDEKIEGKRALRVVIQNIYNLTLHSNVLQFMKSVPNLVPMLQKMADIENDEIQLHAYRCLGKVMMEEDLKRMANADKIAGVYIDCLTQTIHDPKKRERFHSLLESLKNFIQHDQVKAELIKQEALPLLLDCAIECESDPIKVQQISIEILLGLSFDEQTCSALKQNEKFVNYVRNLTQSPSEEKSGLQRAAEGLLWKLEKEEAAVAQAGTADTFKYDIMISYSHRDQTICFRIHDQLISDGFRVWIDRDCLRGATMAGIANAIENSEHVLICMSTTYKQSVYCQSEAHYAFERGCKLIPVLIEPNYKPDGWLGMIVSGKIYVDYTKTDLKSAYDRLRIEIRQNTSASAVVPSPTTTVNECFSMQHSELTFQPIADLPSSMIDWNDDHVKSYLIQIGVGNTLLPLCARVNGPRLLHLCEMCLSNRESMYQSLKFELNERFHRLLPIADYLTFLHETESYLSPRPRTLHVLSPSSSMTFCNLL